MKKPTTPTVLTLVLGGLFVLGCGGGGVPSLAADVGVLPDLPDTAAPDPGTVDPGQGDSVTVDPGESDPGAVDPGQPDLYVPPPCEHGDMCDDGDPCTYADQCKYGVCEGTEYSCGDGSSCTHDLCDGAGGCDYPLREDRCLIAGACFKDGDPNPENPCEACVVPVDNVAWTASDGDECDDGNFCTVGDACMGGQCKGLLPNPCDDGNYCTDDGCDPALGCTHEPNDRPCSDGNPCTVGDFCDKYTCWPGETIVTCDDKNNCTNDTCDPSVGCVYTPNANPCNDGNVCTLGDQCGEGSCQPGTGAPNCADTNPCTDDLCHPKLGCQHPNNEADCNDGNFCTDGDKCTFGQCVAGPGQPNCHDGNPCTSDFCDPTLGGCAHTPQNGPCDDGDPCTLGDFCASGECQSGGGIVNCDDGNLCTLDTCDSSGVCLHLPADLPCDDGNPCTLNDQCIAGACQPGAVPLVCANDNPCTYDFCDATLGCVHAPNDNTCTDGNACTVGDRCQSSTCIPGNKVFNCNDDNPCTTDECDPAQGCVFQASTGTPCDDGDQCSFNDVCMNGVCEGSQSPCDDGNGCTQDYCLPGGDCDHMLLDTPECKPDIVVSYPPRGAMILGPPDEITVTGTVSSTGGPITEFLINDQNVVPGAGGAFSYKMIPRSGTNIIRMVATNAAGGQYKAVRAYEFSHKYYPTDPSNPAAAAIPDGLRVFLGPTVFDDNNTSTVDDFATIILLMLGGIDLESLIPSPLAQQGILHCTATIYAKNIQYNGPDLDLCPVNGGLHARVKLTNISMDIDANMSGFLCPSASGKVTASSITVDVDLLVNVPTPGTVKVTLGAKSAAVNGLNISLDGLLGFLFNWLVGLFSGTITDMIETTVVDMLDQFASILEDALESLEFEIPLTIPPLIGSGSPTDLNIKTTISSAQFDASGADVGLTATALTPKGVPYDPLGSLARSACLASSEPPFHFIEMNELEFGIFDDLLNQVLYSVWYGGSLEITLGEADLPPDLGIDQFGVEDLVLDISLMLPPVLTSCTPTGDFKFQVGDVHVHATLTLLGQPMEMDAYASAEAGLLLDVENKPTGTELSFGIQELDVVESEVESVSGGMANAKYALTQLLEDTLLPMLFESFTAGPLASFPIPEIDLGDLGAGFPPGTKFTIQASQIYREAGHTVVSGVVQ